MAEILFEFVQDGAYIKVSAIDPETLDEAVVVVPTSLTKEQMQHQALNKLKYIQSKKS